MDTLFKILIILFICVVLAGLVKIIFFPDGPLEDTLPYLATLITAIAGIFALYMKWRLIELKYSYPKR